jgi:phosphoribosylamine-glycine ligase
MILKIGIVGSGAREMVLLERFQMEDKKVFIIADRINPLLHKLSNYKIENQKITLKNILTFCILYKISVLFILSEKYLYPGLHSLLKLNQITCFFPDDKLHFLEFNKKLTKTLIKNLEPNIIPKSFYFNTLKDIKIYLRKNERIILRGKKKSLQSVKVINEKNFYKQGLSNLNLTDAWFEEYIEGIDISILGVVVKNQMVFFPNLYDFPNIILDEKVIHTGGMGSVNLKKREDTISPKVIHECRSIMAKMINYLFYQKMEYTGFIVGQFRINKEIIKFTEFDIRPGEPELINNLHTLKSSFTESILCPYLESTLDQKNIMYTQNQSAISICFANAGYPYLSKKHRSKVHLNIANIQKNKLKLYWNSVFVDKNGAIQSVGRRIFTVYSNNSDFKRAVGNIIKFIDDNNISNNKKIIYNKEILTSNLII